MNLVELIESMNQQGLTLRRCGDRLQVLGDQSKLSATFKNAIVAHKEALLKVAKDADDDERDAIQTEHLLTEKEVQAAIREWQAIVDGWWHDGAEDFPPACPRCKSIDVAVDDAGRVRCGKCQPGITPTLIARRDRILRRQRSV